MGVGGVAGGGSADARRGSPAPAAAGGGRNPRPGVHPRWWPDDHRGGAAYRRRRGGGGGGRWPGRRRRWRRRTVPRTHRTTPIGTGNRIPEAGVDRRRATPSSAARPRGGHRRIRLRRHLRRHPRRSHGRSILGGRTGRVRRGDGHGRRCGRGSVGGHADRRAGDQPGHRLRRSGSPGSPRPGSWRPSCRWAPPTWRRTTG